ncbi:MAG: hypothetical protein A4S17_01220 [Proteobacteria bacterium HN_bin10]|nr:MAG: hypothetical protein A4S17_01220 [Proteobacteria bacterium HN_bin10]
MLQLLTSRYERREWRKKIEKTLSLPPTGIEDEGQRAIFLYLKHGLKAYKSRRSDPDAWIVGGYATKEVIDRARFDPSAVSPTITKEQVACLGVDPGGEVDETWWDDMLVNWFESPDADEPSTADGEAADVNPAEGEKQAGA